MLVTSEQRQRIIRADAVLLPSSLKVWNRQHSLNLLFTGATDHAPSLQFLKGDPAVPSCTMVCNKNRYCSPIDFWGIHFLLAIKRMQISIFSSDQFPSDICTHTLRLNALSAFLQFLPTALQSLITGFMVEARNAHEKKRETSHCRTWVTVLLAAAKYLGVTEHP